MTSLPATLPPLIQKLLDPAIYPHPADEIVLLQTHVSYIVLAGDYAYKIKKPVNLGFLDFSTLDRREYFCRREVDLNRRLCPDLYLAVVPISLMDGSICLGGRGAAHEWAVQMRRLPAACMLPALLATGQVTPADVAAIARRLAAFHATAATGATVDVYGTPAAIQRNVDENFEQLRPFIGKTIPPGHYAHLRAAATTFLNRHAALLERRVAEGRIRDCHGDVHAGSICLTDDIVIFDCIEFAERFRCGDVAAEIAFLAMDLDHYGRADLAWHFVDAYQQASGDRELAALLDFYKAYRAIVRGKVESVRSQQPDVPPAERAAAAAAARSYFDLAFAYTDGIARPALLIMTGLIGTGKTTLAQALGQRLGLICLSADVTRKRLAGVRPTEHRYEPFGQGIYSEAFSRRTYAALLEEALGWLRHGRSVIVDASYKRAAERAHVRALAAALDVAFLTVECVCPVEIVRTRLEARLGRPGQVSDGRWELFAQQQTDFDPCTEFTAPEHIVVDTSAPLAICVDQVRERLAALAGRWARTDVEAASRGSSLARLYPPQDVVAPVTRA